MAYVFSETPAGCIITHPRDASVQVSLALHDGGAGPTSVRDIAERTGLPQPYLEQILLALPAYPVCGEGCKGLCPVCGANLNERECGCDRKVPDPRWAGLKDIKL